MRFSSLGSGSKGNGTLIHSGNTCILIDNGFTIKEVENRLAQKGLTPLDVTAMLVTHEHADHIKGVGPLARKYRTPVYLSFGTAKHAGLGKIPAYKVFDSHESFSIGDLSITPVVVPHDAWEPTQFVVRDARYSVGVLTDLGSLTPHLVDVFKSCDALLLETNHDVMMLRNGPYPPKLKARVEGPLGHLSNEQAACLLRQIDIHKLQYLVATHISEQNNCIAKAVGCLTAEMKCAAHHIIVADQQKGFDWCQLGREPILSANSLDDFTVAS